MKYIYEDPEIVLAPSDFVQPEGIEVDTICADTKKIATQYCPERAVEYFNKKYPPGKCQKHTSWRWRENEEPKNLINF
jgi:hypothetical protein